MVDEVYSSCIEFNEAALRVTVDYECITTKEENESLKNYFQWKFFREAGRPVPKEEINVFPEEGKPRSEITFFRVRLGEPVYIGLHDVHRRAPHVLPRLSADLDSYTKDRNLSYEQMELIQYAINGIQKIMERRMG
ncbi:MAG: hypothetical protein QMD85_03145 [Candidatus Aenigmarchaeota archaeon]|nr:hypothetical protein [Candidatus Aenigmarchaeota archaeon]MDI6722533.1 hypothetical protein [Candidatus Aenigmarchaeota archaeon]